MRRMQSQYRSKISLEMVYPPLLRKNVKPLTEDLESVSLPADRVSALERAAERPSERPTEKPPLEMMDLLVNEVEVTSSIPTPPLIIRCEKSTQTDPPPFISNPLERGPWNINSPIKDCPTIKQEPLENQQTVPKNIVLLVPNSPPLLKLGNDGFIIQPVTKIVVNK
ncbi:hypothetical protein TNCV_4467401 [Trichonephila clavipes]|nr:hypothetical protein TNCV_4467401 [Trichonephila clavipes]